jgi:hypothetical protein
MAVVKYACETCGRIWASEEEANACASTHKNVVEIAECRYKKKAEPEKYPSSILCTMADGEQIVYYIGRSPNQQATPLEYKSQKRTQDSNSVRYPV